MKSISLVVMKYDFDALVSQICKTIDPPRDFSRVSQKRQVRYLKTYLGDEEVGCQTFVVEQPYIDRDYLVDYSFYYSRCFEDLKRESTRFHFFSEEFDQALWEQLVCNPKHERLETIRKSYLGFMVVRPLTFTFIGRTCLRHYQEKTEGNGQKRHFKVYRNYEVNLSGISLSVLALAFQEQDRDVSACATSALWSALHGTERLFHNPIPTPSMITRLATSNQPIQGRSFPTRGLLVSEVCNAIAGVDLEPEVFGVKSLKSDARSFKAIIYAYAHSGIPIILVWRYTENEKGEPERSRTLHAVTVTGFRLNPSYSFPMYQDAHPNVIAHKIERLFINDDQVGFHARITIADGSSETTGIKINSAFEVGGSPKSVQARKERGSVSVSSQHLRSAIVEYMIIPVYQKIRVQLEDFDHLCRAFDEYLIQYIITSFKERCGFDLGPLSFWEIKLNTVSEFKKEIHASSDIPESERKRVLFAHLPRFLWRNIWHLRNKPAFEFIIDATSPSKSDMICGIVVYQDFVARRIASFFDANYEQLISGLTPKLIKYLKEHPSMNGHSN